MAITFSWIVSIALLGLITAQAILVFRYFGFMVSPKPEKQQPNVAPLAPPAAVILCLRGDDPSLNDCLDSLFEQDYPDFEIHFVLDSKQDPAINRLQSFLTENANRNIKTKTIFLTDGLDWSKIVTSCSLKNQALIAAILAAEESIEVFALVDADGVVEKNWLSELTAPLENPKVGVSTGSRWFAPEQRNPGSLVRQTWNAAALPQMNFYNIPWGGALAIRRRVIEDCDLLSHWSEGFCEDTMLPKILKENDLQVAHVPSVIVECKETTSLWAATNWISRQLLTVRLHHGSWPLVLGHAVFSGTCLVAAVASIAWCVLAQQYFYGIRVLILLVFFLIANAALLQVIQLANRRGSLQIALAKAGSAGKKAGNSNPSDQALSQSRGPGILGSLLTQMLYPLIAVKAALMRKVQWRGITYTIGPGKKISMDGYQPYQKSSQNTDGETSL